MAGLRDNADPTLPPNLLARLDSAQAHAETCAGHINARLAPKAEAFSLRLRALSSPVKPKLERMRALRRLASDITAAVQEDSACQQGCTHCCHIGVALCQTEANIIGQAIGRRALKVEHLEIQRDYGYHMPCTFLKNGACSIYEHRPISCRIHFNLDIDDLLCRLIPDKVVPLPLLNLSVLQSAYVQIIGAEGLADIRAFFPPKAIAAPVR